MSRTFTLTVMLAITAAAACTGLPVVIYAGMPIAALCVLLSPNY